MIYREHYIKPIPEFYDSNLIKIITGIRRSGKSVILEQIMREIQKQRNNIIFMNFEDKRITANISNADILIEYVETHRKAGKWHMFVYKEILKYAEELGKQVSITDYLIWGGFPQRLEFNDPDAQIRYLK